MFGFIGGVQMAGVWGMVLVFIGGFAFMTLYMKRLAAQKIPSQTETIEKTAKTHIIKLHFPKVNLLIIFYVFVVSLAIGGVVAGILITIPNKKVVVNQKSAILRPVVVSASPSPTPAVQAIPVTVVVVSGSFVGVYREPTLVNAITFLLESTVGATKLEETSGWVKVKIPATVTSGREISGWVAKEFVMEEITP